MMTLLQVLLYARKVVLRAGKLFIRFCDTGSVRRNTRMTRLEIMDEGLFVPGCPEQTKSILSVTSVQSAPKKELP